MLAAKEAPNAVLIPQPDRPRLPLRVPVEADLSGGATLRAEVIGSTANVLLLQAAEGAHLPALGTPIRVRLVWDRQSLTGRIAAHGVSGRFLVSMGERAIRGAKRFPVDLQGTARLVHAPATFDVRITDLSTGGARVEGVQVPIGTEIELRLTPPGRSAPINVLGFVVRVIDQAPAPSVGVAFRLVQPSMDVLAKAPLAAAGTSA